MLHFYGPQSNILSGDTFEGPCSFNKLLVLDRANNAALQTIMHLSVAESEYLIIPTTFISSGVSHWGYDQQSIMERNSTGEDEEWYMAEQNRQLEEKFHINRTIPGVFIDSWSQQDWNINDQIQQDAFQRETEKLWVYAKSKDLFEFKTVEDIMEENQALKAEVKWLNDVITNNISELFNRIDQSDETISAVASNVSINTKHIEDNSDAISLVSTTLTDEISTMSTTLTEKINEVSSSLTERVNQNQEEIDHNGEIITSLASNVSANTKNINANSVEISLVSSTLTDELSTMSTTLTEKINEVSSSLTQRIDKNEEDIIHNGDTISALASSVAINSNNIDNNSDEISLVSTTLTESINGVSQQVDGNKAAIDLMEVESK